MIVAAGKLISIGGAEDKGTDLEKGEIQRNNLNFFELGILSRIAKEAGGLDAHIEVLLTSIANKIVNKKNYKNFNNHYFLLCKI